MDTGPDTAQSENSNISSATSSDSEPKEQASSAVTSKGRKYSSKRQGTVRLEAFDQADADLIIELKKLLEVNSFKDVAHWVLQTGKPHIDKLHRDFEERKKLLKQESEALRPPPQVSKHDSTLKPTAKKAAKRSYTKRARASKQEDAFSSSGKQKVVMDDNELQVIPQQEQHESENRPEIIHQHQNVQKEEEALNNNNVGIIMQQQQQPYPQKAFKNNNGVRIMQEEQHCQTEALPNCASKAPVPGMFTALMAESLNDRNIFPTNVPQNPCSLVHPQALSTYLYNQNQQNPPSSSLAAFNYAHQPQKPQLGFVQNMYHQDPSSSSWLALSYQPQEGQLGFGQSMYNGVGCLSRGKMRAVAEHSFQGFQVPDKQNSVLEAYYHPYNAVAQTHHGGISSNAISASNHIGSSALNVGQMHPGILHSLQIHAPESMRNSSYQGGSLFYRRDERDKRSFMPYDDIFVATKTLNQNAHDVSAQDNVQAGLWQGATAQPRLQSRSNLDSVDQQAITSQQNAPTEAIQTVKSEHKTSTSSRKPLR